MGLSGRLVGNESLCQVGGIWVTPPGGWDMGHSSRWVGYKSLLQVGGACFSLPGGWGMVHYARWVRYALLCQVGGLHNRFVGHKQNNNFGLKLIII